MISLQWSQVHAWRLAQHGLTTRFSAQNVVDAVRRTAGIQAQVMSAAELALCTRVEGLAPDQVRAALWQEHTLVKTWAMRATIHFLAAEDLPLYVAARDWRPDSGWPHLAELGLTPAQQEAYLLAVPHVLEQGPMTRVQLAEAVVKHTGLFHVRDLIVSSNWGTPLKPSAFRGDLCFGPGQGKTVTFMNPRVWIGTWQNLDPQWALQEIVRRYLQAYGPANPNDFAFWWGCGRGVTKKLFQAMGEELAEVEVEGWRALALRTTLPFIQRMEPEETIHLLPLFDAYTIGVPRECEAFLVQAYKRQVFNLQGWTFAVVLVNGAIRGLWSHLVRRSQTLIKVNLFTTSTPVIRKGIEAEAERLSHLFGNPVVVEYEAEAL